MSENYLIEESSQTQTHGGTGWNKQALEQRSISRGTWNVPEGMERHLFRSDLVAMLQFE